MTKPKERTLHKSDNTVSKSGQKMPKAGSRKGIPNKATANAREAIARFVDGNAERLQGWLDQIAETDGPKAAWQCFMDTLEFHVPKLARTELTGANGGPVQVEKKVLYIEGVDPE